MRSHGTTGAGSGQVGVRLTSAFRNLIAIGIILLGILFVIIGSLRGEVETVLIKAVNICLECVGIG